jgi:hypothetical protein
MPPKPETETELKSYMYAYIWLSHIKKWSRGLKSEYAHLAHLETKYK